MISLTDKLTNLKAQMYYKAIDLLKGMISIPSFSREEKEVTDFLEQFWKKEGHFV